MLSCDFVHPFSTKNVVYSHEVADVVELWPWVFAQWMEVDSVDGLQNKPGNRLRDGSQNCEVHVGSRLFEAYQQNQQDKEVRVVLSYC